MLPLTRSRNRARFFGIPFSPSALFEGGTVAGAWYDPSDLSTMFTTDAGTTPVAMPGGGAAVSVGRMLDKSGNGNHAIAFNNTTARPELRARVNLLTYSEEFDNAFWLKTNAQVTATNVLSPVNTNTADTLTETAATGEHTIAVATAQRQTTVAGTSYKQVWHLKKGNGASAPDWVQLGFTNFAGYVNFNLSTGQKGNESGGTGTIQPAGNGFYEITFTYTAATAHALSGVLSFTNNSNTTTRFPSYAGNTNADVIIWGADLRPANIGANVPAYQRIADANTYDTSGFPLYLFFDGIDDSMYTPANLNLSGTDKVAVFAGVRKLSTAFGTICETGAGSASGSFALFSNYVADDFAQDIRGSGAALRRYVTYAAPITNVYSNAITSAFADSAAAQSCRINGIANVGSALASAVSTGNFDSRILNIGARNNSSLWFNGHLYSLAVVGSAVSGGNIAAMESWVAQRTGIAI